MLKRYEVCTYSGKILKHRTSYESRNLAMRVAKKNEELGYRMVIVEYTVIYETGKEEN